MKPYRIAYLASARSLKGSEESCMGYVKDAFLILDRAVEQYGNTHSITLFIRASIAENLPWIFFKSGVAKPDFETIITRDSENDNYASDKMMSFVYFGLAKQMSSDKAVAKKYLHKAIQLDPNRQGSYDLSEEYLKSLDKID